MARAHYDEGVDLLRGALDEVRHHRPRRVELPADAGEPGAPRRGGNGKPGGNGRGNGRDAAPAPPEAVEPDETEATQIEDLEDLDSEPPDVRRRRRRAARTRPSAVLSAPADPDEPTEAAGRPVEAAESTEGGASVETAEEAEEAEPAAPLDPVLVAAPDRPPATRAQEAPRRSHPRGRERIVVATIVALMLAVAGALAAVTIADRGTDNESGGATGTGRGDSATVRLAFDAVPVAEGATVERAWTLRGSEGDRFVGTLTFANPTEAPTSLSHQEVIPKSLASSVDDISFDPEPVVIEADPVVQFDVEVPAGGTVTATYRIDVAPDGSERSRLEEWAEDLDAELAQRAAAATTTTTTTTTTSPPPSTASSPPFPAGGSADIPAPGDVAAPAPAPSPPPALGTLIIAKQSVGGDGTFTFTGPGKIEVATSGGTGRSKAISVSPGRYSWTEAVPAGWRVSNIHCTDQDAGPFEHRSTVSGTTATFNVQPGETVVCTWTNRRV